MLIGSAEMDALKDTNHPDHLSSNTAIVSLMDLLSEASRKEPQQILESVHIRAKTILNQAKPILEEVSSSKPWLLWSTSSL